MVEIRKMNNLVFKNVGGIYELKRTPHMALEIKMYTVDKFKFKKFKKGSC